MPHVGNKLGDPVMYHLNGNTVDSEKGTRCNFPRTAGLTGTISDGLGLSGLEMSPEKQGCPFSSRGDGRVDWGGGPRQWPSCLPLSPDRSDGSRRVYVDKRALLPLEFHYQQRKSALAVSDRAFPPSTESFPTPQGLPALSRTPGTQGQCKNERTKGTLES